MQIEMEIPLFPLGVVLLPEMILPLHIFEERYKQMIGRCLDRNEEFGIVYFNGEGIEEVGCTAEILEVLKRYDDGRMDIITRGQKRFAVISVSESETYMQAKIVYLADEAEEETEDFERLAHEGLILLEELDMLMGKEEEYSESEVLDFRQISFLIPSHSGFTPDEKQKFLEMTSIHRRLEKGVQALERILERTRITQDIERIIGGNGNLPKGPEDMAKDVE
jgi:Lon protease-like protein